MKKSTAYSRKRKNKPQTSGRNKSALDLAIGRSSSYADHHPVQAEKLLDVLDRCFSSLNDGAPSGDGLVSHDELMTAFSTARIRSVHVSGSQSNPAWPIFSEGIGALNRASSRKEAGEPWSLRQAELLAMDDALDAYAVILMASSPLQMQAAWEEHHKNLQYYLESLKPADS